MPQNEIEIILARQLASYLATPMFIVDPHGDLLYYNEPAEKLLGYRFEQTGAMPAAEWSTLFDPTDDDGHPFPTGSLPLVIAFVERRPAQHRFWIRGLDNARRCIEVVAFPLMGQQDRFVGAAAIFWEVKEG
jgi:PAS domain-containing protein